MTRSELIELLQNNNPNLHLGDADRAVRMIQELMTEALSMGHRAELRGFGSFNITLRKARLGRNPKTGEAMQIPPKRAVHFKPGKELRISVDNGLTHKEVTAEVTRDIAG